VTPQQNNFLTLNSQREVGLYLRTARTGFSSTAFFISAYPMIILYTDESGVAANLTQHFFVLAGVSIFERQTYWLASELDKIASRFNAAAPSSIELHGSSMFTGRGYWRRVPAAQRIQAIKDALGVLRNAHYTNRVFACIVKKSLLQEEDATLSAFKHLVASFDAFLKSITK
jgi:hypothetical protein